MSPNVHSRPTFRDGVRLGLAQANVVGGVALSTAAIIVGSALLAVLGGLALVLGLATWGQLGWRWTP